ncbi:MAG: hypothetical protein ACP5G4_12280, partial [bacterium]
GSMCINQILPPARNMAYMLHITTAPIQLIVLRCMDILALQAMGTITMFLVCAGLSKDMLIMVTHILLELLEYHITTMQDPLVFSEGITL